METSLGSRTLLAVLVLGVAGTLTYTAAAEEAPGAEADRADVVSAEVDYTFDVEDERKLVGFATDVFFGRVVEQVGSKGIPTSVPGETVKQTQFSVAVEESIKGKLSGTVTVNQDGGAVEDGHTDHEHLELVEGDPLLVPGQEYLFVTRHDPEKGWHTIAAQPYGDVKVKDGANKKALKDKFEKAKKEQIPFDPTAPQSPADVQEGEGASTTQ